MRTVKLLLVESWNEGVLWLPGILTADLRGSALPPIQTCFFMSFLLAQLSPRLSLQLSPRISSQLFSRRQWMRMDTARWNWYLSSQYWLVWGGGIRPEGLGETPSFVHVITRNWALAFWKFRFVLYSRNKSIVTKFYLLIKWKWAGLYVGQNEKQDNSVSIWSRMLVPHVTYLSCLILEVPFSFQRDNRNISLCFLQRWARQKMLETTDNRSTSEDIWSCQDIFPCRD